MKLKDLAQQLGCDLRAASAEDGDLEISGVSGMEHASPSQITFLANPRYAHKVKDTRAGAIIAAASVPALPIPVVVSENPYVDFARALALFYQPPKPAPGIHPTAVVAATAKIGEDVSIGACAVVGERATIGRGTVLHPLAVVYEGAAVGEDCILHSHTTVREFCTLGNRVILQNGVVVGGDGFGFAKRKDGSHMKIVQSGPTVIEDDVEIQTLSSVDRATVGETRVRRGAKIDSLVQVGHACEVGEDNIICSQTGLAGSTILKKNVLLAGQVGVSGHLTIHENAIVYAQSGIGGDVDAGSVISGSPAFEAGQWRRCITTYQRLPEIQKTVRQLEKKIQELEARLENRHE
ncbi:MAG: UDP-3-O-(3-hydroxymyristoyl)glucosamine N-acyltransferase [Acidobacteria bacterium]|nr:UDP-3-O-(3-hydroxymyristoyl)glucosamine N-acyltransferase [Acidobacteriota bacterium]